RMLTDLLSLPPPPEPPPPPVTLSLMPEPRPLIAPMTGESPCILASAPLTAALVSGPPSAMSSRRPVRFLTWSPAVDSAFSPAALSSPLPASFSRSIATFLIASVFSAMGHLPELAVFLAVRRPDDDAFLAVDLLAGAFLAAFLAVLDDFFAVLRPD